MYLLLNKNLNGMEWEQSDITCVLLWDSPTLIDGTLSFDNIIRKFKENYFPSTGST